jgi:hypothetical protein
MKFTQIADEINMMAEHDQRIRSDFYSIPAERQKKKHENIIAPIDEKNTQRIKQIIEEIGYPTISKVGKTASFNTWLLVQHSPDQSFRSSCLQLMQNEKNDINPQNIAYLEDRLNMLQNKPQRYGTQLRQDQETGRLKLYTITDIKTVNDARQAVGLETLEEYLEANNASI